MSKIVIESKNISFKSVSKYDKPFKHFQVEEVFNPLVANKLLEWLEHTSLWEEQIAENHLSNAFDINPINLPPEILEIFSGSSLLQLVECFEHYFATRFKDEIQISVFKHLPGQGTAIHTDYDPTQEIEFTHRFILYINKTWKEEDGGLLGLFESYKVSDLVKLVPPVHNSGIGIHVGPTSYHAVGEVFQNKRYGIVFSLLET